MRPVELQDRSRRPFAVLAQQRGMSVEPVGALVMQAHQQMVAGPGRRDVQKAQPLGGVERVLTIRTCFPSRGLETPGGAPDPNLEAAVRVPEHGCSAVRGSDVQSGEDDDRKLQSLGAVDGEDAQRVVVGLGHDDLDGASALVGELLDPLDEAA